MSDGVVGLRLRRDERGNRPHQHQRRHAEIGRTPAVSVGEKQRSGASGKRADPVTHLRDGREDRLLVDGNRGDAPAVDRHVLRRAGDAERDREGDRPRQPVSGVAKGDAGERRHDGDLRKHDPAAPAPEQRAENRRIIFVEKRRPDEFELVGDGELAHQPDRLDRNLRLRQPRRLRDVDEEERNSRAEAEPEHRQISSVRRQMGKERIRRGVVPHLQLIFESAGPVLTQTLFDRQRGRRGPRIMIDRRSSSPAVAFPFLRRRARSGREAFSSGSAARSPIPFASPRKARRPRGPRQCLHARKRSARPRREAGRASR